MEKKPTVNGVLAVVAAFAIAVVGTLWYTGVDPLAKDGCRSDKCCADRKCLCPCHDEKAKCDCGCGCRNCKCSKPRRTGDLGDLAPKTGDLPKDK